MTIQRSYMNTTQTATLTALYTDNAKGKCKLSSLMYNDNTRTTEIALSKVWVNNSPATHLKGFKSLVMPQEGVELNIQGDSYEITLRNSPFKPFSLSVKVTGDKEQTLILSVPDNLKGMGLKKVVAKHLGISDLKTINIKYEGYPIDNSLMLRDSNLEDGAELTLDLSPDKSMTTPTNDKITDCILETLPFSFVKPDVEIKGSFSSDAPRWRTVGKGMNLMATCTTKACLAFQQLVIIPRGMKEFRLNEESAEAKCPECKEFIAQDITNCALWDCTYSVKGKMIVGRRGDCSPSPPLKPYERYSRIRLPHPHGYFIE